jgi:hypothetical protein
VGENAKRGKNREWLINDELLSMWKDSVTAQFKILSVNLRGGIGENQENLDSRSKGPNPCVVKWNQSLAICPPDLSYIEEPATGHWEALNNPR